MSSVTGKSGLVYGSVCSGIEAASVAWHPLGWTPAFFSEIDAFPRAVLKHHYPGVPLHGDFTTIKANDYDPIDLLVGGTPCQSFSLAGLRGGMADERGNLALEYLRLAQRLRPRWLVWENVPGVLSSGGGRDFGSILGGLGELGYGFAYRVLDAQYVRVHGFGRAVPQRRRRVFVVGHLGDWRRAAAVLFERESLQGHSPPRREAREDVALALDASSSRRRVSGMNPNQLAPVSMTLNAKGGAGRMDYETETLVAHSLRGGGFDAGEDGTGRGTPLVPVATVPLLEIGKGSSSRGDGPNGAGFGEIGDPMFTLQAGAQHGVAIAFAENTRNELRLVNGDGRIAASLQTQGGKAGRGYPCIAFSAKDHGADAMDDLSPTLRAGGFTGSHANAGVMPAVLTGWRVRRLMPVECERLQGFPDGFTDVPYRRRNTTPDGPRYKALGNSMAVNCMRWIGWRIQQVDARFPTW